MHTCPPPIEKLREWLTEYNTANGKYGHLLLEQNSENNKSLIDVLRLYFESAHLDAREYFHAEVGIDLHPDADAEGAHAQYPNCLPSKTRRGLFGEVIAGLVTESYKMVGGHTWSVPIFLFRFHEDAEAYLFALARDSKRKREIFGRKGDDFIGISLDEDGYVTRFIAGEAKWRNSLTDSVVEEALFGKWVQTPPKSGNKVRSNRGVWFEINRALSVPQGMRQLQRLLQECAPEEYAAAIFSLDKVLALKNEVQLPRTNLILIAGNAARKRKKGYTLIDWENTPAEYTSGNDLQVVEVILEGGDELIDSLYDSLWAEGEPDASA